MSDTDTAELARSSAADVPDPGPSGPDPSRSPGIATDAVDRSLPDDVKSLIDVARTYAAAEIAFQKSRASYAGEQARGIVVYGIVAAVLVFFAVMGLVFGLILALGPWLTPWGSTAVVTGALLIGAVWFALKAKAGVHGLVGAFAGNEPAA